MNSLPPPVHFAAKTLECDVLVAGGGMAGVCCAIAAARRGVRVVLVQDRPVLGGNASSEVRMHIVGANTARPCADLELELRESGLIEEIRLENAFRNPQRSPSMFDFILYEKCRAEKNLTLLLNTAVTAASVEDGCIQGVSAVRTSTEDVFQIQAAVYVDCTGDCGLGVAAGAAFMRGREDRVRFGETLALDDADEKTLGSTLLLMARQHDRSMPFVAPPWARKFTEHDLRLRPHATREVDSGLEYGYWWIEWGGQLDTIKDNEAIRDELLAIVMGVWDHIKNGGDHGADCWALDWFGVVPGKRESRRLLGQHILTEHDLLECLPHRDAIAYGGWPIDLHPPEGVDRPGESPCTTTQVPFVYDIPLRSCVARDLKNLLFAGRNVSASHVAFASTRVMATCAAIGEGVGAAAAHAAQTGIPPAHLAGNDRAMDAVRQSLMAGDCFLIGSSWLGENDLSRSAKVHASSESPNGPAANILSGQTRAVHSNRGVPPERVIPGTHRWISDPGKGLPAWIELRWSRPVKIAFLEIVFDTGLHRLLTLSQSDAYTRQMCWGTGQPECVRDYQVDFGLEGNSIETLNVSGNWQRRNVHRLKSAVTCDSLRITVSASWGIDHARIARVRVLEASQPSIETP